MPTVVHFEIPADDLARAKDFYENLFGWKIQAFEGETQTKYMMVQTTDLEGNQGVCGGMLPRQAPEHTPVNYIGVPSVDEYLSKIESLGGKVIMGKTPVPECGYFAVCLDTENNAFGIWEELKRES
jgi:predicted enzyme related to lactoylglutathione lyase